MVASEHGSMIVWYEYVLKITYRFDDIVLI